MLKRNFRQRRDSRRVPNQGTLWNNRLVYFVIATVGLQFAPLVDAEEGSKEDFYKQMSRAVVRLEHIDVITRRGQEDTLNQEQPDGTGFFVRFKDEYYLVSARHVVQRSYDLRARVTVRHIETNQLEVVELHIPKAAWVFHPDQGNDSVHAVDVAAVKLGGIRDRAPLFIQESLFAEKDPWPPDIVLVFGYPERLGFELHEQRPFARIGIVAFATDEAFIQLGSKYLNEGTRLLDVPMFGGNSGSPVFNRPEFGRELSFQLLGLVIVRLQWQYAVCEPISHIKQTLQEARIARRPTPIWRPLR